MLPLLDMTEAMEQLDLPEQVFFKPNEHWWEFLKNTPWLRYKKFIDVGAGVGYLTKEMIEHGYECTAIDLFRRDGQVAEVIQMDACQYHWNDDCCALLARPCHGLMLEELLMELPKKTDILYIGKPYNVEEDLHGFSREQLSVNVGKDFEVSYRVYGDLKNCATYTLIEGKYSWYREEGYWDQNGEFIRTGDLYSMHDEETRLENTEREVLERKRLLSFSQYYEKPEALQHENKHKWCTTDGWIEPTGEWHPCGRTIHDDYLAKVFGITTARAEQLHFIRCHSDFVMGENWPYAQCQDKPLPIQKSALRQLGIEWKDDSQFWTFGGLNDRAYAKS